MQEDKPKDPSEGSEQSIAGVESVDVSPVTHEVTKTRKRKVSKKLIIMAVVALLVLGFGLAAVFVLGGDKTKQKNNTPSTSTSPQSTSASKETPVTDKITSLDEVELTSQESYSGYVLFYYEPTGRYFGIPQERTLSLNLTVNVKDQTKRITKEFLEATYKNKLLQDGYVAYTSTNERIRANDERIQSQRYRNGSLECELLIGNSDTYGRTAFVNQICADSDKLAQHAIDYEPFYAAYEQKTGATSNSTDPYYIFINLEDVMKSDIPGYEYVKGGIGGFSAGGATAAFYRVTGGEWRFAYASQMIKNCTDYDTPDLQKAFAGENCLSNGTGEQGTVRQYYGL